MGSGPQQSKCPLINMFFNPPCFWAAEGKSEVGKERRELRKPIEQTEHHPGSLGPGFLSCDQGSIPSFSLL